MPQPFHSFPCPGCGAELAFSPADGCLTCTFCGYRKAITQEPSQIKENDYEAYLQPNPERITSLAPDALQVTCSSCSATVSFVPPQVAGECPFCGNQVIAQPQSADPMVAPEAILPFSITQQQADEALKRWLSSRWFAPNALKSLAYREGVSGIYLPYWTFDTNTLSSYTGERGEYYYVTEQFTQTDTAGNTIEKSRQVQKTRWISVSGQVNRSFDDVLVAATESINRDRLLALEPWDLNHLKAYTPAYLAGFKAQRYEVELVEGFEIAKKVMASAINHDVLNDIGGDEQRITGVDTQYSAVTFKHLLLPVYLGAYRFNQKSYQVMINAQTGMVQGDRPFSLIKIVLFILFLTLVIGVIIFLVSSARH
jgi:DNA-directed RNA polymerase subunit RPC12/RpoP